MTVKSEKIGSVAVLRINTAQSGLMTARLAHELLAAIKEADAASDIHAVILTGDVDGVFIRHFDVNAIVKATQAIRSGQINEEAFLEAPLHAACDLCESSGKPFIAAINGICMGGGLEVAMACDIRICKTDVTKIGFPEIRIGIFPGSGGTQRLTRGIGKSAAASFMLQGAVVNAQEAHRLHIVNELSDDPLASAMAVAATLAGRSPEAVATLKDMVRRAHDGTMSDGLRAERLAMAKLAKNTDAQERMQAFLDSGAGLEEWP